MKCFMCEYKRTYNEPLEVRQKILSELKRSGNFTLCENCKTKLESYMKDEPHEYTCIWKNDEPHK